jgi:hypothetical protein
MARIITKELAVKIVRKLSAAPIPSRGRAHDLYEVRYRGRVVAVISLRRGSEKDQGHDHLPRDLHLSPNRTKLLGQCPFTQDDYFQALRGQGLLPEEEDREDE